MLRSAHVLQLAVVALLAIGVLMVHSASLRVGTPPAPPATTATTSAAATTPVDPPAVDTTMAGVPWPSLLATRHAIYAALAVIVLLIASRLDLRQLFESRGVTNPVLLLLAAALGLVALTLIPGIGRVAGGASRWLHLGPASWGMSFQPSEVLKWVLILALAWWCVRRRGVMHHFWHGLAPPLALLGLACGLVIVEDWGTAALMAVIGVTLLFAAGARWWHLALMAPPAIAVAVVAILHSPYRLRRLTTFLDPWADPAGAGYHPIQSMLAIAQGGVAGRGLGNGIQKFGYLPEDTTDFIFAIVCEELGLAGAALVVGLYLTILILGLVIIRDYRHPFGRLVGLGVLLTLGLQAVLNIAVVTVVVPTKGIALPLVSAGGTGWVLTAFALGLIAALDNAGYEQRAADVDDPGAVPVSDAPPLRLTGTG
ncbi:MAG: putative peptidoglycan glycosyltransferase FtsW [Phycisphaeraceae bacterium]